MTSHSMLRIAGTPLNMAVCWIWCLLVLVAAERDGGVYKALSEAAEGVAVKQHSSLGAPGEPRYPGFFWSCDVVAKLKAQAVMPDDLKGLTVLLHDGHDRRAAPLHCITAEQEKMIENAADSPGATQEDKDQFAQLLVQMWMDAGILVQALWSAKGIAFAEQFPKLFTPNPPVENHWLTEGECHVLEENSAGKVGELLPPGSPGLQCDEASVSKDTPSQRTNAATIIDEAPPAQPSFNVPRYFWTCPAKRNMASLPHIPDELQNLHPAPLKCLTSAQETMIEEVAGPSASPQDKMVFTTMLVEMWIAHGIIAEARWSKKGIAWAKQYPRLFPSNDREEGSWLSEADCKGFEQNAAEKVGELLPPGSPGLQCNEALARPASVTDGSSMSRPRASSVPPDTAKAADKRFGLDKAPLQSRRQTF